MNVSKKALWNTIFSLIFYVWLAYPRLWFLIDCFVRSEKGLFFAFFLFLLKICIRFTFLANWFHFINDWIYRFRYLVIKLTIVQLKIQCGVISPYPTLSKGVFASGIALCPDSWYSWHIARVPLWLFSSQEKE